MQTSNTNFTSRPSAAAHMQQVNVYLLLICCSLHEVSRLASAAGVTMLLLLLLFCKPSLTVLARICANQLLSIHVSLLANAARQRHPTHPQELLMQLRKMLPLALISSLLKLLLRLPQQLRSQLRLMLGILASTNSSSATANPFALIVEALGCSKGVRAGHGAEFCVSVMAVAAKGCSGRALRV
jgi:hypothetical protein